MLSALEHSFVHQIFAFMRLKFYKNMSFTMELKLSSHGVTSLPLADSKIVAKNTQ